MKRRSHIICNHAATPGRIVPLVELERTHVQWSEDGGLVGGGCPTCGSTRYDELPAVTINELARMPGVEVLITSEGIRFCNARDLEDATRVEERAA